MNQTIVKTNVAPSRQRLNSAEPGPNPSALKAIRKLLLRRLQKTIVRPTCNLGRTIVSGDAYKK